MWGHFQKFISGIVETVGTYIVPLFGGLCVLVIGWILSLLISKTIENGLKKTKIDSKYIPSFIDEEKRKEIDIPYWVSKIIFYFLLIIVLIAFFGVIKLNAISGPLQGMLDKVITFVPNLAWAGLWLFLAWAAATTLRIIFLKGTEALKIDEKISGEIDLKEGSVPLTKTIADVVYWLVFLFLLVPVLEVLRLEGLLAPVRHMWVKVGDYLPNIFIAGVTLLFGWFIAKVIQKITGNLLSALGMDQLSEKVGISKLFGDQKLSSIIGVIIYIIILLHVLVTALDALQIISLTQPLTDLLQMIYQAVPRVFLAGTIIIIAFIIGRIVADMCKQFLTSVGFDSFLVKMGLCSEPKKGEVTPAEIISKLVLVGIMFFAAITACEWLNFNSLAIIGNGLLLFAGQVILGVIIFVIGIYFANLAETTIEAGKGKQAKLLAFATKLIILIFAGFIALQNIVPKSDIVIWGFILIGGAIAVAIAIAFGVGGIGLAGKKLDEWSKSISEGKANKK